MSERELNNEKELSSEEKTNKKPKPDNSNADYDTVKRALDILKILKEETDSESDSEMPCHWGNYVKNYREIRIMVMAMPRRFPVRWTGY